MKSFVGLKIIELKLENYHSLLIKLNDSSEYHANISSFSDVHCYPDKDEWSKGFIGEFKADIEWPSGFGIHLDQIASLAITKTNPLKLTRGLG